MSADILDLMAGERARTIHTDPEATHPIVDPTDPRCRAVPRDSSRSGAGSEPIVDPTDPDCGRRDE